MCGAAAGLYRERGEAASAERERGREGRRRAQEAVPLPIPGSVRAGLAAAGWLWPPWRRRSPPPARR